MGVITVGMNRIFSCIIIIKMLNVAYRLCIKVTAGLHSLGHLLTAKDTLGSDPIEFVITSH